jgi:N-acetyltransferase
MNSLKGKIVTLVPINKDHFPGLSLSFEKQLTQYFSQPFESPEEYYEEVVVQNVFGPCEIFTIVHNHTGKLVGCTGFFNEDKKNKKIEIGGTWIGKDFQNSAVNSECKLLLMTEGFEKRHCIRIELKTDGLNTRSQAAMEKLGFKREGVSRSHILLANGRRRDSVFFSVIDEEWPSTQAKMLKRIEEKLKP